MSARWVLDSSVVIATLRPEEAAHPDAVKLMARLQAAIATGDAQAFAPAELWLEVYVAEQRLAGARQRSSTAGGALDPISVELLAPSGTEVISAFLEELTRRMRGRRPFANGTDLMYVWAARHASATLITLDEGLLRYHGVMCDVIRPRHALLTRG